MDTFSIEVAFYNSARISSYIGCVNVLTIDYNPSISRQHLHLFHLFCKHAGAEEFE